MTPDEKRQYALSFPVHVGVDTGKQFHVLVARGPDGFRSKALKVVVGRTSFEQAADQLLDKWPGFKPQQILVGLEFAGHHGFTFARLLAGRGHPIVNVLPVYTKRTKEIEDNSPLKTDAKDAALICKLVGDGTFVRFPFLQSPYTELRLLTTQRYRLTVEETRFKNRLQGLLDLAWPEFVGQFSTLRHGTPRAILERWPLPEDLLRASPRTVQRFIRMQSRGQISAERIRALIHSAATTVGLPDAAAERRLELTHLLARWRCLTEQRLATEECLERVVAECPEATALMTVPEVSAVTAATLVAELGSPQDFEHPRQVLKLAGMNLIERSSGMMRGRQQHSKRGRPMLRRQLFLLAGRWCQARGLYHRDYQALVARNGGHGTKAVCALARKLVPLLLTIAQSGEPFDRERWEQHRRATS